MLKNILKWVTIGGVFAVPTLLPFIVSTSMFFPYITGKNFTFRIIVEVVCAAWVVLAIMDAKYRPRFSWILACFTLFLAIVGVADLFGANAFKSIWSNFERMEGFMALLHLYAYFVVASSVLRTERLWYAFWYASLATSVVVSGIGLAPILTLVTDTGSLVGMPRIEARFGNPIYLAVYALFHAFMAAVLLTTHRRAQWLRWFLAAGMSAFGGIVASACFAAQDKSDSVVLLFLTGALATAVLISGLESLKVRWLPWLLGVAAAVQVAAMVLTLTRGTVLGFIGGCVVAALLIALLERERPFLRWSAVGVLALLLTLVGGAYAVKDTEWAKQLPIVNRFTQIKLSEGTVNARFMNWGMAWQGVKERPLLGWGQDNYEYVFSKYFDPNMYGQEPWFDRTHDIIFDWLIAAGFLGLGAYLLINLSLMVHLWVLDPAEHRWSFKSFRSFSAIRSLLRRDTSHAFSATERALWTGLIAAYFFHNLFVFDNIVSYILFVSVLAYLHWRSTESHAPVCEREVADETVRMVVLPVACIAIVLVLWYVNVPGIRTAQALITPLRPEYVQADGTQASMTPERMLEYYRIAAAYDQLGRQEVREQIAQNAANMQRSSEASEETKREFMTFAREEMDRELARNPNSARLLLFKGSLETSAGDLEAAEQAFTQAVEQTPTKQIAIFQLGEVKLVRGKIDEALALFKRAYELQPKYDEARNLYALALIRSGRDKEAVDLLTERYGTAAVDDSRLFMEWVQAERYDIAAQILEARVAANPDDLQQAVSLAAAYKKLSQKDKAVALLEKLKAGHPEYAEQMQGFIKEIRGY